MVLARVRVEGAERGNGWPARALVGREHELAGLVTALQRPPALGLVEGEPGIGKTRLVSELVHRADDLRIPVLTGRCRGVDSLTAALLAERRADRRRGDG